MRQARDLPSRAASPSWRKTVLAAMRSDQVAKASIPTLPRSALCQSVIRWWILRSHWPKVYPRAILICRNLRFGRAKSQILSDTSTRSRKSDPRRKPRRSTVRGTAVLRWGPPATLHHNKRKFRATCHDGQFECQRFGYRQERPSPASPFRGQPVFRSQVPNPIEG
jgi:hypothetical protein